MYALEEKYEQTKHFKYYYLTNDINTCILKIG